MPADSHEITDALSQLTADAVVLYYKARNFHWNVQGPGFFTLHEQFEKLYTALADQIDAIAERVRTRHGTPPTTLAEVITKSRIQEVSEVLPAEAMVAAIAADLRAFIAYINSVEDLAEQHGDRTTADTLDDVRDDLALRAWMFESYLGKA